MSLQELFKRVRAGKADELAAFLDQNEINLNQVKKYSDLTPLNLAAMCGHLEVAELLLLRGAKVNFKSEAAFVCPALRKAVEQKKVEMVKLLIKHGAETVYLGSWECPLTSACEQGDLELVRALLPDGASRLNHFTFDSNSRQPSTQDQIFYSYSMSPVNTAIEYGHVEVVEWLLNHGAEVPSGALCLVIHCFRGGVPETNSLVKMLLDKGAEVNLSEQGKASPLMLASFCGKSNVVEMLLKRGAEVDYKDKEDYFSLFLAVQHGHTEVVKHLLGADARVNVKIKRGFYKYPLEAAVNQPGDKAYLIAKLLLDKGADPNLCEHESVLIKAIKKNQPKVKVVELLLDRGAEIDYQPYSDLYALKGAVSGGHLEIVRLLLSRGARTDLVDDKGKSILMFARNVPTARLLLDKGVPIDHQDNDGGYALLDALRNFLYNGSYKLAEFLLERGANPDLLKEDNTSASSYIRNNYSVIQVRNVGFYHCMHAIFFNCAVQHYD